jgi:hypothetical protein
MTMPRGYATINYCICGHVKGEHTREFKINRGTMPKGMKEQKSKTDISHNACNRCECTVFIDKEINRRVNEQTNAYQNEQMNAYQQQQQQPPQPTGIEPMLVDGEQVFWRRELTKGFWKKTVIEVQMITSRAVRVNQGALDLQTVDKIAITNRHSRSQGSGVTYSVGGRGGGPRVHMSEGRGRSVRFGDLAFFSQGQLVFTVQEVQDPTGIVALIKAANPHIK